MRRANWTILENEPDRPLLIMDLGPWNRYLTITNDAENVVKELNEQGHLVGGRRLFYIDSEFMKAEIVYQGGTIEFKAIENSYYPHQRLK